MSQQKDCNSYEMLSFTVGIFLGVVITAWVSWGLYHINHENMIQDIGSGEKQVVPVYLDPETGDPIQWKLVP